LRLTVYESDLNVYMQKLLDSREPVSAFDLEWSVLYHLQQGYLADHNKIDMARKGQPERRSGLFQIAHQEAGLLLYSIPRGENQRLPQSLLTYFSSRTHIKTGVNIVGDARKLLRDYQDISPYAMSVDLSFFS